MLPTHFIRVKVFFVLSKGKLGMNRLVTDQNDLVTLVCEFEFRNGVKLIGGFYWGCAVWFILLCWTRKKVKL